MRPRPPAAMLQGVGEGRRRFSPRPWQHDWHHLRELRAAVGAEVRKLLRSLPKDSTILDFGAGEAPYRELFAARADLRYLTCDLDGQADLLLAADGGVPLPDASAEAIVSFQVVEHVADLETYLSECRRLLRGRGRLLLSTHGTWLYHPHPTDYRRWTRDGLVLELERHGFATESIQGVVGPLAWTTQFRLFGYRSLLLRVPLLGPPLTALLSLAMNLRMILEEAITPDWIRQDNACVYVVSARPAAVERPALPPPDQPTPAS